jgi:SIR2-like domain
MITFNYDTLVECLVATPTGILGNPNQYGEVWQGVSWTELTGDLPPWAPGRMRLASTPAESLRLLKLHGSLNWYWQPGDTSGISVARRPLPGYFAQPLPYTEEQRRRDVPGRAPFVVPPAASKSEYYSNPITKEMWTQAAERLARAQRVVFMGYSLPTTDVTFTDMLRASIQESDCDIVIADYDPAPVQRRLTELGIAKERIHNVPSGPNTIKTLVQSWTQALSQDTPDGLSAADENDRRLVLSWGDGTAYAPVEKLEPTSEGLVAIASRVFPSFVAATGINSPNALPASDLIAKRDAHASSGRPSLYGKPPGQGGHIITKCGYDPGVVGQGTGRWLVLQVAATPPPVHLSD